MYCFSFQSLLLIERRCSPYAVVACALSLQSFCDLVKVKAYFCFQKLLKGRNLLPKLFCCVNSEGGYSSGGYCTCIGVVCTTRLNFSVHEGFLFFLFWVKFIQSLLLLHLKLFFIYHIYSYSLQFNQLTIMLFVNRLRDISISTLINN